MADDGRFWDDASADNSNDVTLPPDPIGDLVQWTREVKLLELIHNLVPDAISVVNEREKSCALACSSQARCAEVFCISRKLQKKWPSCRAWTEERHLSTSNITIT